MYYTNSEGENGKRYFCKKQVSDFNLYFVANVMVFHCTVYTFFQHIELQSVWAKD